MLRVENATLRQSLDIKNNDAADLFSQLQKAERSDKGKETAFRMVNDILFAYPDEFNELLQKSRAKKSAAYISEPKSSGNDRGGKKFNITLVFLPYRPLTTPLIMRIIEQTIAC